MRYFVTIDGEELSVEVQQRPGGGYRVAVIDENGSNTARDAEVSPRQAGNVTVHLQDRVIDLVVDGTPPQLNITASGHRAAVTLESERMRAAAQVSRGGAGSADGVVSSPMPGKVVKVLVAKGDSVEQGAPMIVVEAMKMENELTAPCAGTVQEVFVTLGDAVEGGARLVTVA